MERIGIYGGTFDPPHIGHVYAARQALRELELDRLLLIPTGNPHYKTLSESSGTAHQRMQMLQLAFREFPQIQVSDLELGREDVSYTFETVLQIKAQHPDAQLVLLMGSDMFLKFDRWVHADIIAENATLGVFLRGGKEEISAVEKQKALLAEKKIRGRLLHNDVIDISSTQLRRMIAFRCADPFLPDGIGEYIWKNHLYRVDSDLRNLPMDELEAVVVSLLNPNRVAHVLGCRESAVELAKHWGADVTDAARAGLLHDITKALDGPLQLTLCHEYGTILDEFSHRYPKTLHALTGSLVAERIFGENDAVCQAIRHHTTGKADMNLLEKIIYIADYIEPNRTLPYVRQLRHLAFTDLDAAVKLGLEKTLEHLATQGDEISPATKEALEYLNR